MNTLARFRERLSRHWWLFLAVAAIAGAVLRLLNAADMEYKEDEEFNFLKSQTIGVTEPWPWVGIPTGVYLVNPGMSIWIYRVLAGVSGATTPVALAHALQLWSWLGILGLLVIVARFLEDPDERELWLWSLVLAMVNPFQVLYERKLWPEGFFPLLTTATWIAWWKRDRWFGAFAWGLLGALLGQVHLSGFFLAFAVFLWTLAFGGSRHFAAQMEDARQVPISVPARRRQVRWGAWVLGSCLGAWPLLPWLQYVLAHPVQEKMVSGWTEIMQFKFWVFWLTDAVGLHLGNPLGLLRGNSTWAQLSDFVRYPLLDGGPTWLVGAAHAVTLIAALTILISPVRFFLEKEKRRNPDREPLGAKIFGLRSESGFLISAALLGFGILLTITGVNIRRYYMVVAFPLEFVFLVAIARRFLSPRLGRVTLAALWLGQLGISAGFVHYVHVNEGAPQGDYGDAFHKVMRARSHSP